MTTEDAFRAAIDAAPDDDLPRLVFADWLEERGDPRAEGYRAMGACRLRPCDIPSRGDHRWSWGGPTTGQRPYCCLPRDWYDSLAHVCGQYRPANLGMPTRRVAEDAAALAFVRLPTERRAELLSAAHA